MEALVTRTYSQGDMRLKPAAAMVESGEVREVVEAIWQGDGKGYGEMFQNVSLAVNHSRFLM